MSQDSSSTLHLRPRKIFSRLKSRAARRCPASGAAGAAGICQLPDLSKLPDALDRLQKKGMVLYEELYVRTQYDGRDLMSVEEIYYYDQDGEERVSSAATNACIDISTCADQGTDLWPWLRTQIEMRLRTAGIKYEDLYFEDELGQ